jgi:hypothetical protein
MVKHGKTLVNTIILAKHGLNNINETKHNFYFKHV